MRTIRTTSRPTQTDPLENPAWLSAKEAARILGDVSDKLIYKLYHQGELQGVKIAGAVRIRASSVASYLDLHSNREAPSIEATGPEPSPRKRRKGRAVDDFTSFYLSEMDRIERRAPSRKKRR